MVPEPEVRLTPGGSDETSIPNATTTVVPGCCRAGIAKEADSEMSINEVLLGYHSENVATESISILL